MGWMGRFPGWFSAVLVMLPAGGAVLAQRSCGVHASGHAADTLQLLEEPHVNHHLAILLCGSAGVDASAPGPGFARPCTVAGSAPTRDGFAVPIWDDSDDRGERWTGAHPERDEGLLQGVAPLLAGEEQPSAARPARTAVWRRKDARRLAQAPDAPSTPPPVGETKWAVWGGLTPASEPRADIALDGVVAAPAAGGKPPLRTMHDGTYSEKKRVIERMGGVPSVVADIAASGGLPLYRPVGGPEGVGVVVKPRWLGVALGAVFE